MRVAVNVEQLLYRSPGGVGRYTAQLVSLLPTLFPDDEVLPFTALHRRGGVEAALAAAGAAVHSPDGAAVHKPAGAADHNAAGAAVHKPAGAGDRDAAGDRIPARGIILPLPRPVLYESWVRFGQPPLHWGAPRLAGADLIHAPSLAVPPKGRSPLVVTVHDLAAELYPDAFSSRGRRFHHRGLRAAAVRADLVLTVSQAAADEITAHSQIPAGRIRVVLNGVTSPSLTIPERQRVLLTHRLSDIPYVLWIGTLEPRKGVTTLASAMADLRRRALDGLAGEAHLVLAGYPGWLTENLISGADRAALAGRLHQLGPVSEHELWALYAGATVFAFPSRHEGFGLPVLEAMAAGTAVVCSDVPALREVSAGAAKLVPAGDPTAWADALEALLSDDSSRDRLVELGLARSAELSAERCVRGVRAVYAEAAGS